MSWLVFNSAGMFLCVVLSILMLFVFQVNGGVVLVLLRAIEKFSKFIEDLNLIDLPLEGGRELYLV